MFTLTKNVTRVKFFYRDTEPVFIVSFMILSFMMPSFMVLLFFWVLFFLGYLFLLEKCLYQKVPGTFPSLGHDAKKLQAKFLWMVPVE